ncbi:MAG: glycoside hydrolase family 2 [Clostridiales bacterium]|nr:glycoside hydrolase family 2 [Clostridiales bacterium]
MQNTAKSAHPRPDFKREDYQLLDGAWQFAFDDKNLGIKDHWDRPGHPLNMTIQVPFCYQSEKSGIHTDEIHPILWYRRAFSINPNWDGKHIWLRFGAVDFEAWVYVNGRMVGSHKGGYAPFGFDITQYLVQGENDLCLRVVDTPDLSQPRGKQYWQRGLMGCWYTPVSGIWQSVYLEATGCSSFESIHVTPDIDRCEARIDSLITGKMAAPLTLGYEVSLDGKTTHRGQWQSTTPRANLTLDMREAGVDSLRYWRPEDPALYQLTLTLYQENKQLDRVTTYFGMRKIEVQNGQVLLNHQPIYQRLVLDQGYWPDTLLTPPDEEALIADVQWIKKLGFNGVRKHQKMEDPRFYHWCDRLGLLVWAELPACYTYNNQMLENNFGAMMDFINRDYNHPSIIAWVPFNESWGVREIYADKKQQSAARMLTQLCYAADGTRIVSANDGWEQTETDICALHDYAADGKTLKQHFADRAQVEKTGCDWRLAYAKGVVPTGEEAFIITEYGGIAMQNKGAQEDMGGMATWGYHDKVADEEAFLKRFEDVTSAIRSIPYCVGYCYTQLTDVMQEINGLLGPDRVPKADPDKIRAINQ